MNKQQQQFLHEVENDREYPPVCFEYKMTYEGLMIAEILVHNLITCWKKLKKRNFSKIPKNFLHICQQPKISHINPIQIKLIESSLSNSNL